MLLGIAHAQIAKRRELLPEIPGEFIRLIYLCRPRENHPVYGVCYGPAKKLLLFSQLEIHHALLARSSPNRMFRSPAPVSYTHLRAHETDSYLVCRLLLEKKKKDE